MNTLSISHEVFARTGLTCHAFDVPEGKLPYVTLRVAYLDDPDNPFEVDIAVGWEYLDYADEPSAELDYADQHVFFYVSNVDELVDLIAGRHGEDEWVVVSS